MEDCYIDLKWKILLIKVLELKIKVDTYFQKIFKAYVNSKNIHIINKDFL